MEVARKVEACDFKMKDMKSKGLLLKIPLHGC